VALDAGWQARREPQQDPGKHFDGTNENGLGYYLQKIYSV